MLIRLFSYMKQYKKYAVLAMICITAEGILELLVPLIISKSFEGRTKKVMYLVTTILFVAYGAFQGFWFAYTYESDFLGIYTEWIYTRIMRA